MVKVKVASITLEEDWGVGGQRHAKAALPLEKKKLDGHQDLSGKDETSCPHRGSNPEIELIIRGNIYFRNVIHILWYDFAIVSTLFTKGTSNVMYVMKTSASVRKQPIFLNCLAILSRIC
jgi:hypothetical protein